MTGEEVRRHAAHMCEVWDVADGSGVFGVIDRVRGGRAHVGGHVSAPSGWVPFERLETSCQVWG